MHRDEASAFLLSPINLILRGNAMNRIDEVRLKQKRGNRILFSKQSECLQELLLLFQNQSRRVLALWAFDFAAESVARLQERYPSERRPQEALEAARLWAAGKIKMRTAQRKILDCHAFAKEIDDKEAIAICHAVGQACSVVHTAGHAIGYPIYDLTAIVYRLGIENCEQAVERRIREYRDRLFFLAGAHCR